MKISLPTLSKKIFALVLVFSLLFFPIKSVFAQGDTGREPGTTTTESSSGLAIDTPDGYTTSLGGLLGGLLSFAMVIGAILLLVYLVWGAIEWITSGGDKGKVENARNKITQAILGMIVLGSVVAIFMLIQRFLGISVLQFPGSAGGGTAGGIGTGGGGTGGGTCVVGSGLQNDGGAGGYCRTGAAMVECHGPDFHLNYNHYDPCYCIEGIDQQITGYDWDSC